MCVVIPAFYDSCGAIAPGSSPACTGCVQESGFNFTGLISAKNQIAAAGYAMTLRET